MYGLSGLSSAWKIDVCLTDMSRAASARRIPAAFRYFFASAAKSRGFKNCFSAIHQILQEYTSISYAFSLIVSWLDIFSYYENTDLTAD
jgi:hypothetical protein